MLTIYKYPIKIADFQTIDLHRHARILSVQIQDDQPMLWALVDPSLGLVTRYFQTVGTGNSVAGVLYWSTHIATFQLPPFVWHLFELSMGDYERLKESGPMG